MTTMNFIDISSWQTGLVLETMFRDNLDLDGVIVKVSQGTGYVNPQAALWIPWLRQHAKPFGTYHYMDGSGAKAEAQHYAESLRPFPGGVPALDYEDTVLSRGTGYLKECLDEFTRLTGVKPLVYCSQSVTQAQDFAAIAAAGYELWVAQYADYKTVNGFVETPWQRGSVAPFRGYVMHQYTSCGRLKGWGSNLDFDQFCGTPEDWAALAGSEQPPEEELQGPDCVVVSEVLMGKYGNGSERAARLRAAGYDPQAVQKKINELYGIAGKIRPLIGDNMEYLNSIMKIVRDL